MKREKIILLISLVIAILFDTVFIEGIFKSDIQTGISSGIFWLVYIFIFYAFLWNKIKSNKTLWYVTFCSVALCLWNFIPQLINRNDSFMGMNFLFVPLVLMAHAQFSSGKSRLKDASGFIYEYFCGWFLYPFSAISHAVTEINQLFFGKNKSAAKKVALGIIIVLPILCIMIPLLSSADLVFRYYVLKFFKGVNIGNIIRHTFIIVIFTFLFFSHFYNIAFSQPNQVSDRFNYNRKLDFVVVCIVLGTIIILYTLFCGLQFTYLFAGAGLPIDMTYAEYAREGFFQTVFACLINVCLFGIFLQFSQDKKIIKIFLAIFLVLTAIVLLSGFLRLKLYIDAYGLTWLRFISLWFIIYVAFLIVLCAIRMIYMNIPAIAVCTLVFLGWFVVLGYVNPNKIITDYNNKYSYASFAVEETQQHF